MILKDICRTYQVITNIGIFFKKKLGYLNRYDQKLQEIGH